MKFMYNNLHFIIFLFLLLLGCIADLGYLFVFCPTQTFYSSIKRHGKLKVV